MNFSYEYFNRDSVNSEEYIYEIIIWRIIISKNIGHHFHQILLLKKYLLRTIKN